MTYQECVDCIMDTSDKSINFNHKGICNYCIEAKEKIPLYKFSEEEEKSNLLILKDNVIKRKKKNIKYDSILGLSGGVDSSYVAYLAYKIGLNPLCVHFDNGWNSEIAVKNIKKIINITKFDLTTYVIDWPEFRDLQRSFFKAGVIDIEMLTDHAIFAALFKIRKEHKLDTVLSGTNYVTEHGLPFSWIWPKMDYTNIKSIHKKFGTLPIKSYPKMSNLKWLIMKNFNLGGIFEEPLNLVNYSKKRAMKTLKDFFDWEYYGGKHYESVFTKFYQAYVLIEKFKVDKRRSHLSCLIRNEEISRDEAKNELNNSAYDISDLIRDKKFVLKKLGFSENEFEKIMSDDPVAHDEFKTDQIYIKPMSFLYKTIFKRTDN